MIILGMIIIFFNLLYEILILYFYLSKFWTRNRPGDKMRDKYNLNLLPKETEEGECEDEVSSLYIPGLGFDDTPVKNGTQDDDEIHHPDDRIS